MILITCMKQYKNRQILNCESIQDFDINLLAVVL